MRTLTIRAATTRSKCRARAFAASNPDVVDRMRSTLGENGSVEALDDDSSHGTWEASDVPLAFAGS